MLHSVWYVRQCTASTVVPKYGPHLVQWDITWGNGYFIGYTSRSSKQQIKSCQITNVLCLIVLKTTWALYIHQNFSFQLLRRKKNLQVIESKKLYRSIEIYELKITSTSFSVQILYILLLLLSFRHESLLAFLWRYLFKAFPIKIRFMLDTQLSILLNVSIFTAKKHCLF